MESQGSEIIAPLKYWWTLLVIGSGLVLLGICIFLNPTSSYSVLSVYFSVTILLNGFFQIFFSLGNRNSLILWGWFLIIGLLDILIGSILISNLDLAELSLPLFAGFWLFIRSNIIISHSIQLKQKENSNWLWFMLFGLAGILFSILMICSPLWGALALGFVGLVYILIGIKLQRIGVSQTPKL